MLGTITSLIGLPGAVLAVWAVLIAALFIVTRGLSRRLAWAFVAGGLAIPVVALQLWPLVSPDACEQTVLAKGDSADGQYAYDIVKNQCRGSSELSYRVDLGRKDAQTHEAALRTVMRSYGFPRPLAVRQVADNHFLIYLTSDGYDRYRLRISLDPKTGEPSYVHRFFQGHSDNSFTVSNLPVTSSLSGIRAAGQGAMTAKHKTREESRANESGNGMNAGVSAKPDVTPKRGVAGESRSFSIRFTLRGLFREG